MSHPALEAPSEQFRFVPWPTWASCPVIEAEAKVVE